MENQNMENQNPEEVKQPIELDPRVKLEPRIIDGKEVMVQVIPQGMRSTALKEKKEPKKSTVKANPTKDGLLKELLAIIEEKGATIYKAKTGYAFKIGEQWFTMNLSANRKEPADLKPLEE